MECWLLSDRDGHRSSSLLNSSSNHSHVQDWQSGGLFRHSRDPLIHSQGFSALLSSKVRRFRPPFLLSCSCFLNPKLWTITRNPKDRPTAAELLQHPFVTGGTGPDWMVSLNESLDSSKEEISTADDDEEHQLSEFLRLSGSLVLSLESDPSISKSPFSLS